MYPTQAEFAKNVNSPFQVTCAPGQTVALELIEVRQARSSPRVEAFSLLFRGPAEAALPQGSFDFAHERLGQFPLFIVPVRRDAMGLYYQAVFNRLVDTT